MLSIRFSTTIYTLVLCSIFLIGCGGDKSSQKTDIASKTSDSVTTANVSDIKNDQSPTDQTKNTSDETVDSSEKTQETFKWDELSGWHTKGLVSKDSSIQINFNRDVIDANLVGKDADKVMFITPSIEGKPVFETANSITWKPSKPLKPGISYKVSIKPLGFKEVPKSSPPFQFSFRVIPLEYQIKTFGLSTVSDDEMMLKGQLLVSDRVVDNKVEKVLTANLQNESLPIEWIHDDSGKQHSFSIRGIKRDSFESALLLRWNGEQINISTNGQKEVAIPSVNTFDITSVNVIHDSGSNPYIEVRFSDELDSKQNLKGLVELTKNRYNTSISGNVINIYPKTNLTGSHTVRLHKGIKAKTANKILSKKIEQSVTFNDTKPQIKFAGKGTILPPNATLDIPFDAVGVKAIDVTAFKIYADNITQFLQNNRLSGSSEIKRSGRYIWRKTILLNPADPNQWNRYTFNVTDLMKEHPGGLVRLNISIKRRHSTYSCPKETPPAETREALLKDWEDYGVNKSSGWDGISDYVEDNYASNNYDWDQRNNPCSDSYYLYSNNKTTSDQNFVTSNIGLITKQDAKGNLSVISTDLRTANP